MVEVKVISGDNGSALLSWAREHLADLQQVLVDEGIVLLRGFDSSSESVLEDLLLLLEAPLMEDARWSSPRSLIKGKTFTSTEYPKSQEILLHSEMAYLRHWPRLLSFQCKTRADSGGETSICHIDRLSEDMGSVLDGFHKKGVKYIRNYRPNVDVPWQNAFGTDNRSEVAKIAKQNHMTLEWLDGDVLRTQQVCQGVILSDSDQPRWFNQAHIFHPSRLPTPTRESLEKLFGSEGMPRSVTYGDGEPIDAGTIQSVVDAMDRNIQDIDWRAGDVAILDNMRWMHGRRPFEGERLVTVALGREQRNVRRTPLFGADFRQGADDSDNPPLPSENGKRGGFFSRLFSS